MIVTSLLTKMTGLATTGVRLGSSLVGSAVGRLRGADSPSSAHPAGHSPSPSADRAADEATVAEQQRAAVAEAVRERQPDVGELADPALDVAEVQAQLQAKHAVETRQEEAAPLPRPAGDGP